MNEHEEKLIAAFILKAKQGRYRFLLTSAHPKRRSECLDGLNHCCDLNEKYTTWIPRNPRTITRNAKLAAMLRQKGSLEIVYVLACACSADGKMMPLLEALDKTTTSG